MDALIFVKFIVNLNPLLQEKFCFTVQFCPSNGKETLGRQYNLSSPPSFFSYKIIFE